MKELNKYVKAKNIKDLETKDLEAVFQFMSLELGKIKVELDKRSKGTMTGVDIRDLLEDLAWVNKDGKKI